MEMVTYPISLRRVDARSGDTTRREKAVRANLLAMQLEDHINALLKAQREPIQRYPHDTLAAATGVPLDLVQRFCAAISSSHDALVAYRHDLTAQEALALHRKQQET